MTIDKRNVPGPTAQAVLARDAVTISPSYPRDYPFVMDHGRGAEVWDVDGHRYIDWAAGIAFLEQTIFAQAVPPEEVAAILVEPIQGEGGYIVPPDGFLPRLREICDRHGILLIVDEVQSGMGRTGRMWAVQHWGVEPDIVCIAKGIASGVPLGAMVARRSLMTWPRGAHGNTYGGNPLACAAALATIRLIRHGLMQNAARQGAFLMESLAAMQPRHPSIGQVRGKGLMIGVEFVKGHATKEPAPALRDAVLRQAFVRGLLLLGCGRSVVRIIPPLAIDQPLVEEGLAIFEAAVAEAEQTTGWQ